ncbi:Inositol polyphosphate 4-phosphatase type II [Allomyces arbusculus]|nr:Inositol polyphosphate 4-phosphatase type II [Allomyces arbusculus]
MTTSGIKINEADVAYFATSPTGILLRGWMWKRGAIQISSVPTFGPPSLAQFYKKRYFVLKGNLLFYFTDPEAKRPIGVILLEHCQVRTTPIPAGMEMGKCDIPPYHFRISFLSESSHRDYELAAPSDSERVQWIQLIASCNVEYMLNELKYLRRRLRALETAGASNGSPRQRPNSGALAATRGGARPMSFVATGLPVVPASAILPSLQSLSPFAATKGASAQNGSSTSTPEIVEELDEALVDDVEDEDYAPLDAADRALLASGDGQAAPDAKSMVYTPTTPCDHVLAFALRITASLPVSLPSLPNVTMTKDAFMYLSVQQARTGQATVTEWVPIKQFTSMSFFTTPGIFVNHPMDVRIMLVTPEFREHALASFTVHPRELAQYRLVLPFDGVDLAIGTLLWSCIPTPTLPARWPRPADPSAIVATAYAQWYQYNGATLVREETCESPWVLDVPRQLLRCWIAQEQRVIRDFSELVPHAPDIHVTRLRQLDIHKQLLCYFEDELRALDVLAAKDGAHRLRRSVEKTPQHLQMVALNCTVQRLRVMPASESPDTACDSATTYSVITVGAPTAHALAGSGAPPPEAETDKLVAYHATTVSNRRKAELRSQYDAFVTAVKELQRVADLVPSGAADADAFPRILDTVTRVAKDLAAKVVMVAQSLRDLDEDALGGYQAHVNEVGCQLLEEWVPLAAVRGQQVVLMPNDATSMAQFAETVATLADRIGLAHDGAIALLDHHRLLIDAKYSAPTTWQATRRRQDWVFAQALGALVTAFEETVQGWVDHDRADLWGTWVAIGWLFQFESLLTPQGDELAMLVDMKAALLDMERSVSLALHALAENGETMPTSLGPVATDRVVISGERGDVTVSLGVPAAFLAKVPRRDTRAKVRPVLFTQGINDQPSLATVFGGATAAAKAQDAINRQSYDKLQLYVEALKTHVAQLYGDSHANAVRAYNDYLGMLVGHLDPILRGSEIKLAGYMSTVVDESALSGGSSLAGPGLTGVGSGAGAGSGSSSTPVASGLRRMLGAVTGSAAAAATGAGRGKNTDILAMAAHITRVIASAAHVPTLKLEHAHVHDRLPAFGAHPALATRATTCKSAKDRTGMAVTLEECLVLQAAHMLSPGDLEGLLTAMRACGPRRTNVRRNIGGREGAYAFHAVQWTLLPRLYRPPRYTISDAVQT